LSPDENTVSVLQLPTIISMIALVRTMAGS
jgi:hypothetical protein